MKNKKLLLLILPVITLFLEALPYGAVLNFAEPEGESARKTFSYFSLIPFGYANFAPFITAVITCVAFILLVIYCFTEKENLLKYSKGFILIGAFLSLCPLGYGISFFSAVAVLITISLIAEFIIINSAKKSITQNYT